VNPEQNVRWKNYPFRDYIMVTQKKYTVIIPAGFYYLTQRRKGAKTQKGITNKRIKKID
jgi:hypothetical protein